MAMGGSSPAPNDALSPKFTAILLLLLLLFFATPTHAHTHYANDSCQLIGDGDLYGPGVRTGYYLAFFAITIAVLFDHAQAAIDSSKTVMLLTAVILPILIRDAVQEHDNLAAFEWYLIGHLINPPIIACSVVLIRYNQSPGSVGSLSVILGLFNMLSPWPLYSLLQQGHPPDCELKAIIFATIDFYNGGLIIFFKIMTVLGAMAGGAQLIAGIFLVLTTWVVDASERPTDKEFLEGWRALLYILSVGVPFIAFAERLLVINAIDLSQASLASTSQLIPFLAGLFGFVSTVWTIATEAYRGED